MLIFWVYHIIWANICKRRYENTETKNLKFWAYIKNVYPAVMWGFLYGMIPVIINWVFISVVFINYVYIGLNSPEYDGWEFNLSWSEKRIFTGNHKTCGTTECISIFEYFNVRSVFEI
jgi:hypothetical protein